MKSYLLKAKDGKNDLPFVLSDLMPVHHKKEFTFQELTRMINYRDFYADSKNWKTEDWEALYRDHQHQNVDLFTIRDTGVIVIPGNCLFPTILKENEIETF